MSIFHQTLMLLWAHREIDVEDRLTNFMLIPPTRLQD